MLILPGVLYKYNSLLPVIICNSTIICRKSFYIGFINELSYRAFFTLWHVFSIIVFILCSKISHHDMVQFRKTYFFYIPDAFILKSYFIIYIDNHGIEQKPPIMLLYEINFQLYRNEISYRSQLIRTNYFCHKEFFKDELITLRVIFIFINICAYVLN